MIDMTEEEKTKANCYVVTVTVHLDGEVLGQFFLKDPRDMEPEKLALLIARLRRMGYDVHHGIAHDAALLMEAYVRNVQAAILGKTGHATQEENH